MSKSITTKTGDKGQTSLWSGERVSKDNIRIEAYGTLDELNSHLGEIKHYVNEHIGEIIENVQQLLVRVMGELASKGKKFKNPINMGEVAYLTTMVTEFERDLTKDGFVTPGRTINSAKIDICRTVCRRAERRIVSLSKTEDVSDNVICFVNRLSDFLFLIAQVTL
jgi:ATP:cob(I)alamin adenosyltransferase